MEFRFNLNEIFSSVISKIDYSLLPSDFSGDKSNIRYCTRQVAEIIDEVGYASAKAQALQHPIVTADKLRNTDHTLYLMIDPDYNNGKGSVIGLLKVGFKNLFLFDETGMIHEMKSMCILDFYVHESKQRTGFGKKLYDYMLSDKNIAPCKLAIDRPSEKFLSFLYKHYGLGMIYPRNNNFVLFEGFFSEKSEINYSVDSLDLPVHRDHIDKHDLNGYDNHSINSDKFRPTLYGRHAAVKLPDTMGEIIGQGSTSSKPSPTRSGDEFRPTFHGRHTAVKLDYTMGEIIGQGSTSSKPSPTRSGDEFRPTFHGRHTAVKLDDTMGEIIEQGPTSSKPSPTRSGDEFRPTLHGRHTAVKLDDTMGEIIEQGPTSSKPSPTRSGL